MERYSRPSKLQEEARKVGHPDPSNATWGEVNILSLYTGINCGPLSSAEAEHILHVAEFDADFNS